MNNDSKTGQDGTGQGPEKKRKKKKPREKAVSNPRAVPVSGGNLLRKRKKGPDKIGGFRLRPKFQHRPSGLPQM